MVVRSSARLGAIVDHHRGSSGRKLGFIPFDCVSGGGGDDATTKPQIGVRSMLDDESERESDVS